VDLLLAMEYIKKNTVCNVWTLEQNDTVSKYGNIDLHITEYFSAYDASTDILQ